MFAPESVCAPVALPFSTSGDRDLAERLGELGLVLEELHHPDRAGEPRRAAADDRDADLDPLVLGIRGRPDELLGRALPEAGTPRARPRAWLG